MKNGKQPKPKPFIGQGTAGAVSLGKQPKPGKDYLTLATKQDKLRGKSK